jgi:hypothetical protein
MIVAGLRIILQSNMSIYLPRWRILTTNKATIWLARVNRLRLKGGAVDLWFVYNHLSLPSILHSQ